MNATPKLHPTPATPKPEPESYERPSDGCASPRALGSAKGMLNLATPVESCAEKLSSIPWIVAAPLGMLMVFPETTGSDAVGNPSATRTGVVGETCLIDFDSTSFARPL